VELKDTFIRCFFCYSPVARRLQGFYHRRILKKGTTAPVPESALILKKTFFLIKKRLGSEATVFLWQSLSKPGKESPVFLFAF
jgi:hypothetical protein